MEISGGIMIGSIIQASGDYTTTTKKDHMSVCNKSTPKGKPKPKTRKVVCPKCDPQTREKMEADKLQEHIQKNHIDWGNYD